MLPQNNGEVKDATPKKAVNARDRAHSLEGYPPGDRKAKAPAEEARVKVNRLLAACAEGQDPSILVALATSAGGLIDDEVRRKACTWNRERSCTSLLKNLQGQSYWATNPV